MTKLIALLLTLAQTQSIPNEIESRAKQIIELASQLPTAPVPELVTEGESLTTALISGSLVIDLQAGATYTAPSFRFARKGQILRCHGATLVGTAGPAVHILPNTDDVWTMDCLTKSAYQTAIQCGDNSSTTQGAIDQMPTGIVMINMQVLERKGKKRGIEVNCAGVFIDSFVDETFIAGQDSQAMLVMNTCGPVIVLRGTFIAASENIMVGGDTMKMPCEPTDLMFDGVKMLKPPAWRGTITVKNIFELKAGVNVTLQNSLLDGSWKSGQDGSAVVITPRNGQRIKNVTLENNIIRNVAQGLQLMGHDSPGVTPELTSGVKLSGNSWKISGAANGGGRGILALVVAGMTDATFTNEMVEQDGNVMFFVDTQEPVGPFTMTKSTVRVTGKYAVQAPGVNYGGPPPADYAHRRFTTVFEGNTFVDAPNQFKANYPNNTWFTAVSLERLRK